MTETTKAAAALNGRTSTALAASRAASDRAGNGIGRSPLAVVAGGVALGVVAGSLLPKSRRETELLGAVGRKVTDAAAGAASAARGAASAELASLPLTKAAAREQIGQVLERIAKALASAGDAALGSTQTTTIVADKAKPARKGK